MGRFKTQIELQNRRLIECELYNFKSSCKELDFRREEIIEGSAFQEVCIQSGTTGNSTARKAERLMSSRELNELERRIGYINNGLTIIKNLPEKTKYKLVNMKYLERKFADDGICEELGISNRTFIRWKKESLQIIADCLGWRV